MKPLCPKHLFSYLLTNYIYDFSLAVCRRKWVFFFYSVDNKYTADKELPFTAELYIQQCHYMGDYVFFGIGFIHFPVSDGFGVPQIADLKIDF